MFLGLLGYRFQRLLVNVSYEDLELGVSERFWFFLPNQDSKGRFGLISNLGGIELLSTYSPWFSGFVIDIC